MNPQKSSQKKTLKAKNIIESLCQSILKAGVQLPPDIKEAIEQAQQRETLQGKTVLSHILENLEIAKEKNIPLCQDTGMVILFVTLGRDLIIEGSLEQALFKGVEEAYEKGYFRKSVVKDPLKQRENTQNNLPPVIYYDIVEGCTLTIEGLLKGFGSENCSQIFMLKPTDSKQTLINAILGGVKKAGASPCPPTVLGIGIGGTMDYAAKLSKKALLRDLKEPHPDSWYASLEKELFDRVNDLKIGPGGLGGKISTLGVKIETYPTHIAGLPVALSINCWADRKFKIVFNQD